MSNSSWRSEAVALKMVQELEVVRSFAKAKEEGTRRTPDWFINLRDGRRIALEVTRNLEDGMGYSFSFTSGHIDNLLRVTNKKARRKAYRGQLHGWKREKWLAIHLASSRAGAELEVGSNELFLPKLVANLCLALANGAPLAELLKEKELDEVWLIEHTLDNNIVVLRLQGWPAEITHQKVMRQFAFYGDYKGSYEPNSRCHECGRSDAARAYWECDDGYGYHVACYPSDFSDGL